MKTIKTEPLPELDYAGTVWRDGDPAVALSDEDEATSKGRVYEVVSVERRGGGVYLRIRGDDGRDHSINRMLFLPEGRTV